MIDPLGDRMKGYEDIERKFLTSRTPIILRLDGRAFHTFTVGLKEPFDNDFRTAMEVVTCQVMAEIQGAVVGYVQSDEISIFLHTWNNFDTQIWFDGNVQKMVSVAASTATMRFNNEFKHPSGNKYATFDARVFTLPKDEVSNYFLWRHKDAMRNAISAYAEHLHGHKACQGVKTGDKLNMIPVEDWQKVRPEHKFGTFVFRPLITGEQFLQSSGKFEEIAPLINELVAYQNEI